MNEGKTLCVIVPYRNRESHLSEFLPWIERVLTAQHIEHTILVVEQREGKPFNRGKLLNVGYHHTKGSYDNYCFHDVDLLPLAADYSYCATPTHLAVEVEQFGWRLAYYEYFGGVVIFDRESFSTINGYANKYWGWGAEDDDVFGRGAKKNIRLNRKTGRFRSLPHDRRIDQEEYEKNIEKLKEFRESAADKIMEDGLNTLQYEVMQEKPLSQNAKKITVEI